MVTGSHTVARNFVISKNLPSLFSLCALAVISAYLAQTAEMETTPNSIGCYSVRTALVVRWHPLRTIALVYNFWWSSLEDVLIVGDQEGTTLAGNSGGSAARILVAKKLTCYLSLGYTRIMTRIKTRTDLPFCPGQIRAVSVVKILKCSHCLPTLLHWAFIGRWQTIPVLWVRYGN